MTDRWHELRLLFVMDHFGSGGAQRQMVLLASALSARGHTVEFFTYHRGFDFFRSSVVAAGCTVHEVNVREIGARRVVSVLRRLVRDRAFDVIMGFMDTPGLYAELAAIGRKRPPVVVSERIDLLRNWRVDLRIAMHRFADLVVANSMTCATQLRSRYPWLESRVRVITNGVDLRRFAPRELASANREGSAPLQLVGAGTVTPRKNLLAVVSALQVLRSRLRAVPVVTWIGKTQSDSESKAYRQSVVEALRRARLVENWVWAGEQSDVTSFFQRADVLVHPSLREGLANAICEALACGLPVLAGDHGDTPWLLGREQRGLLVDPEHPESIADALERISRMSMRERQAMRKAAREFAVDQLGMERYATSYEQLFLELRG